MPRRHCESTRIPARLVAVLLVAGWALVSPTRVTALSLFDAFSHSRTTTAAKQIAPGVSPAGTEWWCRTEGECLPCPPGARDSDVCKVYGNRRPLICVPRHNANLASSPSPPSSDPDSPPLPPPSIQLDDFAGAGSGDRTHHAQGEPGAAAGSKGGAGAAAAGAPKPLVAPAGSRDEADSFAREDGENFGTGAEGAIGQGGGGIRAGEDADNEAGLSKSGSTKADQELADELQAERRRRRRSDAHQAMAESDRMLRDLLERSTGAISTWEACPKVLHSEYHDYFEFILCNAGFAAAAIVVLIFRQRTLALQQFGRLAARIMQTQSA